MRLAMLAFVVALVAAAPAPSQPSAQIGGWDLRTPDVITNVQTGAFTLPNHVNLVRTDGSTVNADRATGNFRDKTIDLSGRVVMHDNSGTLSKRLGTTAPKGKHTPPATMVCDALHIDEKQNMYVATGSVHYKQGNSEVVADRIVLDNGKHKIHLSGHVKVTQ